MHMLTVAHSPDADDAFMFYAMVTGRVECGFEVREVHADIQTLNELALQGRYDLTAISVHAYPYVSGTYALLTCGSSMGLGYGPVVVSREGLDSLAGRRVAIPGRLTSAALLLRLYEPSCSTVEVSFERIPEAVARGEADAGVLIHEAQLSYGELGLRKVVDLGEWWQELTSLPVPLGMNAVKRELGEEGMRETARCLRRSIAYALEHEDEALEHAARFGRGMSMEQLRRFVRMYVNPYTLDCGEEGRRAVELMLSMARERGMVPEYTLEFV